MNGVVSIYDTVATVLGAISAVAEDREFISRWVFERFVAMGENGGSVEMGRVKMLSYREHQVLGYLVSAKTVKETAGILGLAINTVDNHKTRLMKKLEVHSTVELTRMAIRVGLVSA